MSRAYWSDLPTSWPEGYPLDAGICRGLIDNANAVMDESAWEQCIVLPAVQTATADTWYFGPVLAPVRFDRTGLIRALSVMPLCIGGGDAGVLQVWLTDRYREPTATDPNQTWAVDAGATLAWQSAKTITPPRWMAPEQRRFRESATSDERVATRWVWLTCNWAATADSPKFAGLRVAEVVET